MGRRRSKIIITATGVFLMSAVNSFALNDLDIKNDSLEFYVSRYSSMDEVRKYLIQNGITDAEYDDYIRLSKKYRYSKEKKWENIENGSIIIDSILFSNKYIEEEYSKRLKIENNEDSVYNSIKKDILNNPSYVLEIIKETLSDNSSMEKIFEQKYERIPEEKEIAWLVDEKNIKYALYGGELSRMITEREYSLIKQGYGYRLLGLSVSEIEEYAEYILIRDKIAPLEVKYYNSVEIFNKIQQEVYKNYKVNIYELLTENERLEIHAKSVDGINFNEKTAYTRVISKLKEKGLISDKVENTPPSSGDDDKNNSINQDSSSSNPNNELNQHLKENNSSIRNSLLATLKELYSIQKIKYSSGLKNTHIYFKYKNKVVNTYIRMPENEKLNEVILNQLVKVINKSLNSKIVFSIKDVLMLIENEIKTTELSVVGEVLFKDLVRGFRNFGIELYEKEIIEVEEKVETNNEYDEQRILKIDLKGETYEILCADEKNVRSIDFKEMLEKMKMRYIFTTDSVLILREGKLYVIEIDAYNKRFVTAEEIKLVLDKVGIDAVVNTIIQKGD